MNKKGSNISLNFVVGILLAIIIFVPLLSIMSRCTRLSADAQQSFEEMSAKLLSAEIGDVVPLKIDLDKSTRIVIFNSKTDKVFYKENADYTVCNADDKNVKRPKSCLEGTSCTCLCRKDGSDTCEDDLCYALKDAQGNNIEVLDSDCSINYKNAAPSDAFGFDSPTGGVADYKVWGCEGGFAIHRKDGWAGDSYGVGVGPVKVGVAPLCDVRAHVPRTHFLYAQRTSKGFKFCYKLNENQECITPNEKQADELTNKIEAELSQKFESCQRRTGNSPCTCGFIDLGVVPNDGIITVENSGNGGTKFNAVNGNNEQIINGEQELNIPFCLYNLDTKSEEAGKIELRKYDTDDPSLKLPFRHNDKPVLINSGGKVCIAVHGLGTQYSYDENQGDIFTPNNDVVIQSECLYPLLDNNPSIV